jgi:hypothetical protein
MLALCEGAGFRVGEAATMRLKDLKWNEDGSVHATARQSKTKQKTVLIRNDLAYYIKAWVNSLPDQNENNLLFADPKKPERPIQYWTLRKELQKIGKKLGLLEKRKFKFHIFRHRHASWAIEHMNPMLARMRLWNNRTTRMDGIYGAFSNEQVDEEFRKANGDIIEEKKKNTMKEKTNICFKCKKVYPEQLAICPECSTPLTPDGIKEYQDVKFKQVMLDLISEAIGQEKMNEMFSKLKKTIEERGIKIETIA